MQNGSTCIGGLPLKSHGWEGVVAHCHKSASQENIIPHIANPGKDQNSMKSFYWMGIAFAQLKNQKIVSWPIVSQGPSV